MTLDSVSKAVSSSMRTTVRDSLFPDHCLQSAAEKLQSLGTQVQGRLWREAARGKVRWVYGEAGCGLSSLSFTGGVTLPRQLKHKRTRNEP